MSEYERIWENFIIYIYILCKTIFITPPPLLEMALCLLYLQLVQHFPWLESMQVPEVCINGWSGAMVKGLQISRKQALAMFSILERFIVHCVQHGSWQAATP